MRGKQPIMSDCNHNGMGRNNLGDLLVEKKKLKFKIFFDLSTIEQ